MNGMELARAYYEAFGAEMLHRDFPEIEGKIAVGLCGSGSECFGFDDGISRDHDFEPGFCLFLPGEEVIDRRTAFRLERAYAKLPREFEGFRRQTVSPVGGSRRGVIRQTDFWLSKLGIPGTELTQSEWLHIPEYALAEAVNGELFRDDEGSFTLARLQLRSMPEDVLLKRLATNLLTMAQSGQYNYSRIMRRREKAAAELAISEFVNASLHSIFLLNRSYMPYYKWAFRALRGLPLLPELEAPLTELLCGDREDAGRRCTLIEEISSAVIHELQVQALTSAICGDLEKHAWSVNDRISEISLRNTGL